MVNDKETPGDANSIRVSGINIEWHPEQGTCTFDNLPVAMMWVDTTLAGLMSGVQTMVGTERFVLALQSEGRKSVEADWQVISKFPDFREGFLAIARIAAVAGWGHWSLASLDETLKECRFRVADSWEGRYQRALGVCWGSGMLAGKLAGYCSRLFGTNCWPDQTAFTARGDAWDEFFVRPSPRSIEKEIDNLLATDEATRADMAVALRRLEKEIAERQRMEEALRESEALFRSQFEFGNIGIAITSVDEAWVRVNPRLCEMLGYSEEEFLQKTWSEMTHPDDLASDLAQFDRMLKGDIEAYELDKRLFHKDGRIIATHLTVSCFRNPDRSVRFIIGSLLDITKRKCAEEALQESEEKFRNLVETTSDWIWETDAVGTYTYSSPGVRDLLGYEPNEVIGRKPFEFMPQDEAALVEAAFVRISSERRAFFNLKNLNLSKDGRQVMLETSGVPRLDADGKFLGYRGIDRDITERMLAEAERLEMERRLLHAQKLESLGVLAGGIAHDFNNLLMAVMGNLDLAISDLSPTSAARPYLGQAMLATRRAADLTRQMLAYSGKGRFEIARIDLSELLRENTNLFRTAISKTVTMNLCLTPECSTIEADPGQVQQVIMNLITNASEAIGEKAGVITLATGVREFDVVELDKSRLNEKPPAGRFAYVEVSDTGCGMDDETRQRLFDPFFTTKFTGRGLGMSAVLGIVQGHQGAIMVQSATGQGSTIRVLFPACEGAGASTVSVSAGFPLPLNVALHSGTVLVVDDEEAVRNVCAAFLQHLGLRSIVATNGEEALPLFKEHAEEIGCVLLDLTMPRMNGISTFREMTRLRPDIPVILCSGYSEHEAMRQFANEGLAGFIQKPYCLQDLEHNLERVLKRSAETNEDRIVPGQ